MVGREKIVRHSRRRSIDMERTFFMLIEGEYPIVVAVKDDVNRPNNMDCHSVLEEWKTHNYGYRPYDYWEIDTCEKHNI
jgi:hypothetical protein